MTVRPSFSSVALVLSALSLVGCTKEEDKKTLIDKVVDAAASANPPPVGPKNLDLAKPALANAKAKYANKQVVNETDCGPLQSLAADFADSKDPEAIKTSKEIAVFCLIDVKLEGAVTTLKTDNGKLADAVKKKDKTTETMYAATVKDGCSSIKGQLEEIATKKLDTEPKVTALKAEIDPICSAPAAPKKK